MIDGRRVLAVVPARGGSKGLPRKNLRAINGVPLVGHAAQCATNVAEIDRAVVSTDDEEIAEAAKHHGIAAPFRRSDALAGDLVGDHPVLVEALERMEQIDGTRYDLIVMLQPTSPSRTPDHVRQALTMAVEGDWDAVWTVSRTDTKYHPDKQLVVDEGQLHFFTDRGPEIIARQQLSALYHRNGIAYVITRACLMDQKSTFGTRVAALVIDGPVVNIDTALDLRWAQFLFDSRSEV